MKHEHVDNGLLSKFESPDRKVADSIPVYVVCEKKKKNKSTGTITYNLWIILILWLNKKINKITWLSVSFFFFLFFHPNWRIFIRRQLSETTLQQHDLFRRKTLWASPRKRPPVGATSTVPPRGFPCLFAAPAKYSETKYLQNRSMSCSKRLRSYWHAAVTNFEYPPVGRERGGQSALGGEGWLLGVRADGIRWPAAPPRRSRDFESAQRGKKKITYVIGQETG